MKRNSLIFHREKKDTATAYSKYLVGRFTYPNCVLKDDKKDNLRKRISTQTNYQESIKKKTNPNFQMSKDLI